MISPTQREIIRKSLLAYLNASDDRGLSEGVLLVMIRNEGFRAADDLEIRQCLEYLRGKGLAERVIKRLSAENHYWHITAEGRDFHAES